jgi:acyl-CoA reductase-like NAD-dependent aldehyde dehydrogenase
MQLGPAADHPARARRGELNVQRWTPRGVGVVIAPWNFPLAILCGLTVAPVVGGNTVIMKPAEQTSALSRPSSWTVLPKPGCRRAW